MSVKYALWGRKEMDPRERGWPIGTRKRFRYDDVIIERDEGGSQAQGWKWSGCLW
jgi:hypothetical protein